MPMTSIECTGCGIELHTDELVDRQCNSCGITLPVDLYENVESFYIPDSVLDELNND